MDFSSPSSREASDERARRGPSRRRFLGATGVVGGGILLGGCVSQNPGSDGTEPEPTETEMVETDRIDGIDITERYLAADGSTDDAPNLQTAIESEAGNTLLLRGDEGVITLASQCAPTTAGDRTRIVCVDEPRLDITDVAVNHAITFVDAPNVSLIGPVTIRGSTGAGLQFGLQAGDGFRGREIEIDGGQGGLDLPGSDITLAGIEVHDQRDTETGAAACIHANGGQGIRIEDIDLYDADRGVEIEDGSSDCSIVGGRVSVDNSGAANPETQFALDAHSHVGEPDVTGIRYADIEIVESRGFTALAGREYDVEATFENITVVDPIEAARVAGDVVVENCEIRFTGDPSPAGLRVAGGRVDIRNLHADPATFFDLFVSDRALPLERLAIEGGELDSGAGTTNHTVDIAPGTGAGPITVADLAIVGTPGSNAIRAEAGALAGEWGLTLTDCDIEGNVTVSKRNNTPVRIRGTTITGTTTLPDGSTRQS